MLSFFKKSSENTDKSNFLIFDPQDNNSDWTSNPLEHIKILRDKTVADIMVPRADIIATPIDSNLEDLLALFNQSQHSRVPVYKDNLDNVIGTVHVKDTIAYLSKGDKEKAKDSSLRDFSVRDYMTDVPFISPAMAAYDLIHFMRIKRRHMAMVIDEYGGIDGLITLNDLIETIVGDLDDEYDVQDQPMVIKESDNVYVINGRCSLEELITQTDVSIEAEYNETADTVGGFIVAFAGKVPAMREIITYHNYLSFEVLDTDARRVRSVRMKILSDPPEHSTLGS